MSLVIRELKSPEEFIESVEVQRSAWRMEDYREAAPAHLLRALADNGGLVLGAFYENKLVGVSYGWPVKKEYFYSHATGVLSEIKYRGVGFLLKKAQRSKVLEKYGISKAMWTFDPLQGLNSVFNLSKLGVIARIYFVDYYGEIKDSINRGLGTDRVKIEWFLESPRVVKRLSMRCISDYDKLMSMDPAVAIDTRIHGARIIPYSVFDVESLLSRDLVLVPIPKNVSDLRDIDSSLPRKWRLATREVYKQLIEHGYVLVDSVRDPTEPIVYNVMWRKSVDEIINTIEPWRIC